jgi:lipopolysaccharide export system protein LptA
MKHKRLFKVLLAVFLAAMLIYIVTGIKSTKGIDYQLETRADGELMTFSSFTEDNRKALELRCLEARQGEGDRTYMTKIDALIFKKGRMNKDIRVVGEKGYVENNSHDFFIEKNARLVSKDFTITSNSFKLKNRAELFSDPKVAYNSESLKGNASKGMALYLNVNTLKFFNTRGTYKRDKRNFDYSTDTLWFIEKDKIIVLQKDAVIRDETSILRSDWVTLKFNDDLNQVVETVSQKNSYFYMEDKEKNESREIKSENIRCLYDEEGRLTQLSVIKQSEILLRDRNNRTKISSDVVDMYFHAASGKVKRVVILHRGTVQNKGKRRFRVLADSIDVDYNKKGEIRYCQGDGNVEFKVDEYNGTTNKLGYNVEKNIIKLEGANSQLISGNNSFQSAKFTVNTDKNTLTSKSPVKSIIRLDTGNVLFSDAAIFINSKQVKILENENKFIYDRSVNLNQEDVLLEAKTLTIEEKGNIEAAGRVSLSFKSEDKEVALKGDSVVFNSQEKTIEIEERAAIKNGENILQAKYITIRFNDKNEVEQITGREKINFSKEDLSGYSERVEWDFKKEILILRGSPRISKKGSGKTTGDVLKIDLKTNKITILSAESDRTETIIQ